MLCQFDLRKQAAFPVIVDPVLIPSVFLRQQSNIVVFRKPKRRTVTLMKTGDGVAELFCGLACFFSFDPFEDQKAVVLCFFDAVNRRNVDGISLAKRLKSCRFALEKARRKGMADLHKVRLPLALDEKRLVNIAAVYPFVLQDGR